jgi:hypothetical protein
MKRSFLSATCVLSLTALLSPPNFAPVVGGSVEVADRGNQALLPTPVVGNTDGLRQNVYFNPDGGNKKSASASLFVPDQQPEELNGNWSQLLASCFEPDVWLTLFNGRCTAKPLPGAGYEPFAGRAISGLWGRHYSSLANDTNATASQVAAWELAYGNTDKSLSTGAFMLTASASNSSAVSNTAQAWLTSPDGTGTKAQGLVVLQDSGGQRNNQDLSTRGEVPKPGVLTQGEVPKPGVLTQGEVPKPGVLTQGEVPKPGVLTQGEVPEPGMLGLLAVGLAGLSLARRQAGRQRRA